MEQKKSFWLPILIVVVFILIIWGVSSVQKPESPTTNLKIGVVTCLSGDLAVYGEGMKNAIEMAVSDSGLKDSIQLIIEDDGGCKVPEDVSAVQKFINIDKVDAIIGPPCSSSMLSVSEITEKSKIFIITSGASSKTVTVGKNYVFRTIPSDSAGAVDIAHMVFDKGYKDVALLHNSASDAYVQEIADFKDTFEKAGGKVIIDESYISGAVDFRSQLTKIKNSKIGALVISGYPKEAGMIVKQARTLKIEQPIFGTGVSVGNPELITLAGEAAENLIFPRAETPTNKESNDFIASYKRIYGKDPVLYAAESYDAAALLIKALVASDKTVDSIKDEIYKLGQNYLGASGIINFEQTGDVTKPFTMMIVKNGQFVPYEK